MPLGLANGVVAPAAAGAPAWLCALMSSGIGVWNNHPIALAVGTAWIQVGIGVLLVVSSGAAGRAAAAVSVGWATLIWAIGNQFGADYRLGEHPGHHTLLTFLDPLCYTDCPLLANQL